MLQRNKVNSTVLTTSLQKHNAKCALREDSVSRDTSTSTSFQHKDVAEKADEHNNSESCISTTEIVVTSLHDDRNADCNLRQRSDDKGPPMQESASNTTASQRNNVRSTPDQGERTSIPLEGEMRKESSSNLIQREESTPNQSSSNKKGISTSFKALMKIGGISTLVGRGIPTSLQGSSTPPEQTMNGKDSQQLRGRYASAETVTQADAGVQIEERTKPNNHQKEGTTSTQVNCQGQGQNMRSAEVHHSVKSTDNQSNRSDVSSATLQTSESTSLQEATSNHKFINFSQTKMFPENNAGENHEGMVSIL